MTPAGGYTSVWGDRFSLQRGILDSSQVVISNRLNGVITIWYVSLLQLSWLTPNGSSTVHIYTQTIRRTTQLIWEEWGPCLLCDLYPGICLTTEEKARKNLSQGSRRVPVGTMKTGYTEQNIHDNKTIQNYQRDALNIIYSSNIITLLYMFRVSSTHLQEDIVVHMQHMVPSLSIRVLVSCWYAAIGRTPYSCISTRH